MGWLDEGIRRAQTSLAERGSRFVAISEPDRAPRYTIEQFSERASAYGLFASVAALHGLERDASQFINDAASNTVAHGNHKDVLLFHVLHAIRICHAAGIIESRQWLLRFATPIAHVEDFTDGDETGHLPRELAEVLLAVAPDLFPAYYAWLCDKEDSYDALHAFKSFLRVAHLRSRSIVLWRQPPLTTAV